MEKGEVLKRYNKLYEQIYDFENLYASYLEARKNKRYKHEVLEFSANLEENLISLQNELIWEEYRVGKYREFFVYEPKKRLIMCLPFRDRVVQWAIYRVIAPFFMKGFYRHSYACIKKRGTHAAADTLQSWLVKVKDEEYYHLKLDMSKYFYRVNHDILLKIILKKIKDKKVLNLLEGLIKSEGNKFGLPLWHEPGETDLIGSVGMPIGNLTSQLFANIYLNELDKFVKQTLREKYYIRYMDDVIILNKDKEKLHLVKKEIEYFINNDLELHLNNKTALRPVKTGINFVGFRIWHNHRRMKKKSLVKMKKRIKYIQKAYSRGEIGFKEANATMQSYFGIMQHFESYTLKKNILKDFVLKGG